MPLHFYPLALTFPDAESEREMDMFAQLVLDSFADILHRRIVEKVIQGFVVKKAQAGFNGFFQLGEVDDHPGLVFALDHHLDLISMPMQGTAFVVSRQIMGAIDVINNP
jgi:hypothetical protein